MQHYKRPSGVAERIARTDPGLSINIQHLLYRAQSWVYIGFTDEMYLSISRPLYLAREEGVRTDGQVAKNNQLRWESWQCCPALPIGGER